MRPQNRIASRIDRLFFGSRCQSAIRTGKRSLPLVGAGCGLRMAAAQPVATVVLEGLRHPCVDADLVDSEREPTSEEWSSALGDMQVTRSFLKHLFGLSKKGSYIFSRKWCTLAYDRERCAWKIYVPSADPKTYQLAINRKVCEPGATYRVRDGDRLEFGKDLGGGGEGEKPIGCVDVRLRGEGSAATTRPVVAPAAAAAGGAAAASCNDAPSSAAPRKRQKAKRQKASGGWTCRHDHGGRCTCDLSNTYEIGRCAYCRRCDACLAASAGLGGSGQAAASPAAAAIAAPRPPRSMLLPKQAEQLRRTVCDVTYPESPPNKRLVLVLEEMEKYERAFNGEVQKTPLFEPFYTQKRSFLPRRARDKHRKS
jgi:hypothetical protein